MQEKVAVYSKTQSFSIVLASDVSIIWVGKPIAPDLWICAIDGLGVSTRDGIDSYYN